MIKEPRKIDPIKLDEKSPITERIAWHIENALVRFGKRVFNAIANPARSVIAYAFEEILELLEPAMIRASEPIMDIMLSSKSCPPYIKQILNEAKGGNHANDWFIAIGCFIAFIFSFGSGFTAPFNRLIQYETEMDVLSHIPNPETIVAMAHTGSPLPTTIDDEMKRLGIREAYREGYKRLFVKHLSPGEMAQAYYRKQLDELEIKAVLKRQGLSESHINAFFEIIKVIPPIQDLIRFAVRDAWNNTAVRTFGYDQDYPQQINEFVEKLGLSPEWAKMYWRSHWELPGVHEAYQMLHRRIIDPDELELLLRIKDIPSFWRKKLIDLSYNPYTRVDIRRMYEKGYVGEEEVYWNYRDLGYDDIHARKLTDWTVDEYGSGELSLTKAEIQRYYVKGTINETEFKDLLTQKNIDITTINLMLEYANLRKQEIYEDEFVETIRTLYLSNQVTDNDVIDKLNTLNPPSGFADEKLSLWKLQKVQRLAKPTKSELKSFLLNNVITPEIVVSELRKQNYSDEQISWYMTLWTQGIEGA